MKHILQGIISGFLMALVVFVIIIDARLKSIDTTLIEILVASNRIITLETARFQTVTVTMFHPLSRGINSDRDPTKTAFMKKPIPGWHVAVSDELYFMGWIGKIHVNQLGVFEIAGRMDKSIKGKQIDICAPTKEYADNFGIRYNVYAVLLNN